MSTSAPAIVVVERAFGYKTSFPNNAFIVEEFRFCQLKKPRRKAHLNDRSKE